MELASSGIFLEVRRHPICCVGLVELRIVEHINVDVNGAIGGDRGQIDSGLSLVVHIDEDTHVSSLFLDSFDVLRCL